MDPVDTIAVQPIPESISSCMIKNIQGSVPHMTNNENCMYLAKSVGPAQGGPVNNLGISWLG